MMWPPLTKVQYEKLPVVFSTFCMWKHIGISILLNWIVRPLVMLGLTWATMPDLPAYWMGVIMVGVTWCIAMVIIWNNIARGDSNFCAILVVLNALMQIVLYSPYCLLFINIIGGNQTKEVRFSFGDIGLSVLIVSPFLWLKYSP